MDSFQAFYGMLKNMNTEIKAGTYWYCGSLLYNGLSDTDIFAKVLHVNDCNVYFIRTTQYGFESMPPAKMTIEEFIKYYKKLEQ